MSTSSSLRQRKAPRMAKRKNRTFTEREKIIYKAGLRNGEAIGYKEGFLDGENQLQQTLNVIKASNSGLMDELLRLDFKKPLIGDPKHVTITHRIVILKKIIRALQKGGYASPAAALRKHIREHEKEQRIFAARIEKGTEER